MWYLYEEVDERTVKHGPFSSPEDASVFIMKGGAHHFEWVGNKVKYTIVFEENT